MAASGTKEEFSDPLPETEPTTEANFTLQLSTDFDSQQARGLEENNHSEAFSLEVAFPQQQTSTKNTRAIYRLIKQRLALLVLASTVCYLVLMS